MQSKDGLKSKVSGTNGGSHQEICPKMIDNNVLLNTVARLVDIMGNYKLHQTHKSRKLILT